MSLLSIWTSPVSDNIETRVTNIIRDSFDFSSFDSVRITGMNSGEITNLLNDEFSKLVNVTMTDASLHIVAVIPVFDTTSTKQISDLTEACKKVEHSITLHIIGLCAGIAKVLEVTLKPEDLSANQTKAEKLLKETANDPSFSFSYTLIDDYASNGATIGFTEQSLSRYIAMIEIALAQDYYSILSPALLAAHQNDNLAMGVSALLFPKKSAVKQLLGMGFLAALDNVGINDTEVDSQRAAHEAELFLANIEQRYPTLYNTAIRPLYKEKGMTEGKAVAEASDIIKENLNELREDIINLLKDENFSFPEKEAILAMILGRDNVSLHGVQYEHESTILDDICDGPINLYIKAYNDYCQHTKWLPVRGDFEELKIKIWDEEEQKYIDVPENNEALNPLPDIKRLKQQILNTTSFLREKKEELEELESTRELRADADEVRRIWHKPEGNLRDFEYKEQPLDEKYTPEKGLQIKNTVDLRNFFPPVRNQYDLGSCSSFATTAMYEAMRSRGGIDSNEYMSPGFVFYYSNVIKGRPQGGSNYHDQLEVLGKHGVCLDEFYQYDTKDVNRKPSGKAIDDAETHRVLKAKQIVLTAQPDKTTSMKSNHTQITSALSEGYPVGISLKIFDNFGKDGPFILHPEDMPTKMDGYHAMVIAGYSEDNGFYIVRNSWGPNFGDDGYCYIPFSYIDDTEYLDFACIITEITDTAEGNVQIIPTELADFGATETDIKIAAIRNVISTGRNELKMIQKLYAEYYKYYQKLMLRLTMPNVQNNIRKEAEGGQARKFIDAETTKRNLEDTFVRKLKDFKNGLVKTILSLFGFALAFGIAWYYTESSVMMILFIVAAGLGVLVWLGYKWWVRLRRRELQEQLDEIAVNARNQRETFLEMQIRFHVAGMWLSSYHKLSIEIGKTYDRLVSFNDTLRNWQKEYTDSVTNAEQPEGKMFRFLDPSPRLEKFFNTNREFIVSRINLLTVFNDYQAKVDDLDKSRANLDQIVADAIETLMADFNIVNYLLGDEFPYLPAANRQEEIDAMIQIGQPSYRNKERNATTPVRLLMGNVENSRSATWSNAIALYFPLRPVLLSMKDPSTLILITLHPQTI